MGRCWNSWLPPGMGDSSREGNMRQTYLISLENILISLGEPTTAIIRKLFLSQVELEPGKAASGTKEGKQGLITCRDIAAWFEWHRDAEHWRVNGYNCT